MLRIIIVFSLYICVTSVTASDNISMAAKLYDSGKNNYLHQKYNQAVTDFENSILAIGADSINHAIALMNSRAFLASAYWNNVQSTKSDDMARLCYNQLMRYPDSENPALFDAYLNLAECFVRRDYSYDINDFLIDRLSAITAQYYPNDSCKKGLLYFVKGYYNMVKDDNENAIYYLTRSAELLKNIPDHMHYVTFNYVHVSYAKIKMHDYPGTIKYVNEILNVKEITSDGRLLLYEPLALGYLGLHDTVKMQENFKSAIKTAALSSTSSSTYLISTAYFYLANCAGNKEEQLYYLKKALEIGQKMYNKGRVLAILNLKLGRYYYKNNQPLTALRYVQKSIIASSVDYTDTSFLSNPPVEKLLMYSDLIQIFFLKGTILPDIDTDDKSYTKLALQCFETAYYMLDKQLHKIDRENSELSLIDLRQYLLGYLVVYSNYIYRYTGEEEYARKAFYYSEKGKVQVLKKLTEKTEILKNCGVPDTLIRKLDGLGNEILQTESMIALSQEKGENISRLVEKITYLNDQRDFLTYELQEKFPRFQKTGFIPRIPGIAEIQSVLEPDQVMIEYEMVREVLITFVITRDKFYQHYQPFDVETWNHIEKVRKLVSTDPSTDYSDSTFRTFVKSSRYLYDILIRPVYSRIQGKRLVIIPQGRLVLIPFEALVSKDYQGRIDYSKLHWLIEEFPVTYAFSASYLIDKRDQEFGKGMAAFMPVYKNKSDSLAYLKGAANEAKYLRRHLGFRVFSGRNSGEQNFRKKSKGFRVIHIAAHTVTNDNRPDLSAFILNEPENDSTDGRLCAYEIKQMKLNAQFAMLNGCNTGYGTLKLGEGLLSLGRSFFLTGIRTVAFTLWQVTDLSAHDLVIRFYKEIYHGQPTDMALMKSKTTFIKTADPVKAHPYYWAGFILYGKSQVIPFKRDYTKPAAIFLLLLAVISACMTWKDYNFRSRIRISSDCRE